jgi:hypothetical protein
MNIDETIQKLHDMKLRTMASALREMTQSRPDNNLSFEERIAMLVSANGLTATTASSRSVSN